MTLNIYKLYTANQSRIQKNIAEDQTLTGGRKIARRGGELRFIAGSNAKLAGMILESVTAENFRNLSGSVHCGHGLNILIGLNGQGKTNWLEAINVLATARSFRTARLQEAVRFGEDSAAVAGRVLRSEQVSRDLRVAIGGRAKSLFVNGKQETARGYLNQLHSVVFNSDELEVVRGQPEARRRFLDESIISIHPPYVQTVNDYARVIKQKNALLQSIQDRGTSGESSAAQIETWNAQLVGLASRIHRSRLRYVERLNDVLARQLFGPESVSIRYESSLEPHGDLSEYDALLDERLKVRFQAEVAAGYSLIGPHRDDLELLLEDRDVRKYGSAGQQRSILLLIQLANLEVYFSQNGEYPLFLIDDIDAELDHERIKSLLEHLAGRTQTVVTTSKESFVAEFGQNAAIFDVVAGCARPREGSRETAVPAV